MRRMHARQWTWRGGVLLFSLALSGPVWAQGAPAILWQQADGAGTVAFSPSGQLVASAGGGTTIRLRRAADGVLVRSITDKSGINSVVFSPDGTLLADGRTNGSSSNLKLFRVADGTLVQTLAGHSNATRSVAFSPNGALLASGGDDRTAKLWRVSDGALLRTLSVGTRVRSVAFSPGGQLLATGEAGSVALWNVSTGALVRTLTGFADQVMSVAFSPDGSKVAGGSLDGTIRVWLVANGALSLRLALPPSTPNGSVTSIAFSPNGFSLLSGNDEVSPSPEHGTLRFWRVSDGALLKLYNQATGVYVSSVAFSPQGSEYAYSHATDGGEVAASTPF
jgi:WD40 repeat protein